MEITTCTYAEFKGFSADSGDYSHISDVTLYSNGQRDAKGRLMGAARFEVSGKPYYCRTRDGKSYGVERLATDGLKAATKCIDMVIG